MPRVLALAPGHYPDRERGPIYRRKGDEFDLLDLKHYSGRWMKPLDFKPPEGAAGPEEALQRQSGVTELTPLQLKTVKKQAAGAVAAAGMIP